LHTYPLDIDAVVDDVVVVTPEHIRRECL
jgi:hypothetical protein